MLLGCAITEHCNLRCPHCIRDDVASVRSLDPELIFSTAEQVRSLFGTVTVSMTGGEPTIHPEWERIIAGLHERQIPYRFVTNGWHMRRLMPAMDRHPPEAVRISLSGANEEVHDAERGRSSFRRVLMAVALLTSREIPASLSLVVDRRDRHQIREVADLAEDLGCIRIHFILPQPVPGSAARDSDLPLEEWLPVRREVEALAREPHRRTWIQLDYGAPFEGPESLCGTLALERIYVNARGELSTCCQLSEYGFNDRDVVADLHDMSFADAWPRYVERIEDLKRSSAPAPTPRDEFDRFPCMRCARSCGKTDWLARYPGTPWAGIGTGVSSAGLPLVQFASRSGRRVLQGT